VWQAIKKLYTERLSAFLESWYNISDAIMLILYVTSFVIEFFIKAKVVPIFGNQRGKL
jgi:hypothetical protein